MKSIPEISVVMSVYNGEKYLDEAIQSILNQTYKNFEFIIINDGSTDKSLEIIKKYINQDKRIILINRENKGLIASLNEGIAKARGTYIARMDADDISLPNRFEEQVKFMEKNLDVGVCGSWVVVFGKNRKDRLWKTSLKDDELKTNLLFSVPFAHPSVIIRTDLLFNNNIRYNSEFIHAEDYNLWVDLSNYTKFANIQKVLLKYRYLGKSITRTQDKIEFYDKRINILKNIYGKILLNINLKNSSDDDYLHFILMKAERIRDFNFNYIKLLKYFLKILISNNKVSYFKKYILIKLLGKKIISVVYYKIMRNI